MRNAPLAILESDEMASTLDDDAVFNGLLLAVIGRRRLLVLIGDLPGDRVELLGRLARHIAADGSLVLTVTASPGVTVEDLVEVAGRTFLGRASANLDFDVIVDRLEAQLDEAGTGILMVEDADKLPIETLRDLTELSGSLSSSGRFLQVLISGGAMLEQRLLQADLMPTLRAVGTIYRLDTPVVRQDPPPSPPDESPISIPPIPAVPLSAAPMAPPTTDVHRLRGGQRPVTTAQRRSGGHGLLWFSIAATCLAVAGGVFLTREETSLATLTQGFGWSEPLTPVPAPAPPAPSPALPQATATITPPAEPLERERTAQVLSPSDAAPAVPVRPPAAATPVLPETPAPPPPVRHEPEAEDPAVPGPKAPVDAVTPRSQENAALIRDLIQKAEELIDERQLTTPQGDNAMEVVQALSTLDSEHPAIGALKTRMVESYRAWGRNAERRGQWDLARLYYQRALRIDSSDRTVVSLLNSLDRRRKPGRSTATATATEDPPARTAPPAPADEDPPLPTLRP